MENVQEVIMKKMIDKLLNQVALLSAQLAESQAKNDLYLETLQIKEQELKESSIKDEKDEKDEKNEKV
jgi:hypothetical protein